MNEYRIYDAAIKAWADGLSHWHSVLYALCVCQRAAPLYFDYVARKQWGDSEAFVISHRLLRDFVHGRSLDATEVESCRSRVEDFTPSTEEHANSDCACDTGIIHIYALSLLSEFKTEYTYYIARYCYELVDGAAGILIQPTGGMMTLQIEKQIENHPLVQSELHWQATGRRMLSAIPELDTFSAKEFIDTWTAEPIIRSH